MPQYNFTELVVKLFSLAAGQCKTWMCVQRELYEVRSYPAQVGGLLLALDRLQLRHGPTGVRVWPPHDGEEEHPHRDMSTGRQSARPAAYRL